MKRMPGVEGRYPTNFNDDLDEYFLQVIYSFGLVFLFLLHMGNYYLLETFLVYYMGDQ